VEVEAILDFGAVGVAQLVVEVLLLRERLVGADVERQMVSGARAESPATRRAIGFVLQHECFRRAAVSHFETVIRAVDAGLAESERVDEEAFLLGNFPDGKHRPVKPAE